jgi:predicted esterase/Flp pilus assembly protein TadD
MKRILSLGGPLLIGIVCLAASGRAADLPRAQKDATGLQVGVVKPNEPVGQTAEESALALKPRPGQAQDKPFYLYVPKSYAAGKPGPVVVILHPRGPLGMFSTVMKWSRQDLRQYAAASLEPWKQLAERDNILLVLPVGDPDVLWMGVSWYTGDRQKLFEALLAKVAHTHAYDARRVYVVGSGEGGHVAVATALKHGDLFAAVAACNPPLFDGPSRTERRIFPQTVPDMLKDAGKVKPPMLILAGNADKELRLVAHFNRGVSVDRYEDDSAIPIEHIKKMVALLKDGGVNVELRDIAGRHYSPLPDEEVPAVWEFLKKHSLSSPAGSPSSASTSPLASSLELYMRYNALNNELTKAAAEGDHAKAIGICQEMVKLGGRDQGYANYHLTCELAHEGRNDDAFKALNLAIDQGHRNPDRIKKDHNLANLRSDKRFDEALAKADRLNDPTGVKKLAKRLAEEFEGKDYRAAVETCHKILATTPNDVVTLYMLAAAEARLGHPEESLSALAQAVEAGYSSPGRMKIDDDLATIRGDDRFKPLLNKARKNLHTAFTASYRPGKEMAGVKTVEGFPEDGLRYRLRMSADATAAKPNKLVVWMHPSGSSSNELTEPLAPTFIKHGYALLVFTQNSFRDWSDEDAAGLAETVAEVGTVPGIDARKPILFGFSAGGQMALVMWEQKPDAYGGLVLDAAYPVLRTPTGYDVPHVQPLPKNPAIKNVPILAFVGSADRNLQIWKNADTAWCQAGIPFEVVPVPGRGHEWLFDQPRIERLAKWLDKVAAARPPESPSASPTANQAAPAKQPEVQSPQPAEKQHGALGVAGDANQIRAEETKALHEKNYARARELLGQLILLNKEDVDAWYNLACVESLTGHSDKALDCLQKAFDYGYDDFRHLARDTDLDGIRSLPQYKEFLAHKDQFHRARAARIEQGLKKSLGSDYLIDADEENRLVFAANVDRKTLEEVKQKLAAQAKALWNDLFDNHFEQYVTVILLSDKDTIEKVGGGYSSPDHRLVARQVGNIIGFTVLTHEFTHALHWADQEARGQTHPIWIAEGFATFAETSRIENGHLVPLPNVRLFAIKNAIQKNNLIPLRQFIKLGQRQYMQQPLGYPESRYILMYLYSKGLLRKWYDAYVAGYKDDPTGGKALEATLGKNLDEIEKDFAAYVTALKPLPRPFLGLTTSMASDGLKITGVAPGSGAFDAGIKTDDVVTRVNGKRIADSDRLLTYIFCLTVGTTVQVEFRRDGKYQTVPVTLKDASAAPKRPAANAEPAAKPTPAGVATGLRPPTGFQPHPLTARRQCPQQISLAL